MKLEKMYTLILEYKEVKDAIRMWLKSSTPHMMLNNGADIPDTARDSKMLKIVDAMRVSGWDFDHIGDGTYAVLINGAMEEEEL